MLRLQSRRVVPSEEQERRAAEKLADAKRRVKALDIRAEVITRRVGHR